MTFSVRRTNATSLSNDELMLMDEMFDFTLPFWSMRQVNFRECFNADVVHTLDDDNLRKTLLRLTADGILESETAQYDFSPRGKIDTYYGLSALGGSMWEAERTPLWERYVCVTHDWTGNVPKTLTSIYSPGRNIPEEFLRVAQHTHRFPQGETTFRDYTITNYENHRRTYWKKLPFLYVRTALIHHPGLRWTMTDDWDYYEAHRTWWCSPNELQKFL